MYQQGYFITYMSAQAKVTYITACLIHLVSSNVSPLKGTVQHGVLPVPVRPAHLQA